LEVGASSAVLERRGPAPQVGGALNRQAEPGNRARAASNIKIYLLADEPGNRACRSSLGTGKGEQQ
jgi:hypothetical protein